VTVTAEPLYLGGASTARMLQVCLFVELVRSRPLLIFWTAALGQALLWTMVPTLFYGAPPGEVPLLLAVGRHWPLGSPLGPPLAYWLGELAFDLAGHSVIGIYVVSQICVVVTFWAVFALARAIVGVHHAVLTVLLMAGVAVFSVPTPGFGPRVLATALIALALLHYWRAVGQDLVGYWFALACDIAMLLLTSYAGLILVGLLAGFTGLTRRGRASLARVEPWLAGLLVTLILFPHLIWIDRFGAVSPPSIAAILAPLLEQVALSDWLRVAGAVVAFHAGIFVLLVIAGLIKVDRRSPAPIFTRAQVDSFAKHFLYFFALAPCGVAMLFSVLRAPASPVASVAPLVILSGLAVILAAGDVIRLERQRALWLAWLALLLCPPLVIALAVIVPPWTVGYALSVDRPALAMGQFFTDTFRRRTGQPLSIVVGGSELAPVIAMASPDRPSLLLTDNPDLSEVGEAELRHLGAVVVWSHADGSGRPPPSIATRFPDLVLEVPRSFERPVQGRSPLYRVDWAVIRPSSLAAKAHP
jgi:hypothetical protein